MNLINTGKTWLTSDWHIGENRFTLMGRPFNSEEEMIDLLVKNHNQLVKPDDLVIVNGDVCYQNAPQFLPHVSRFNGKKILIRGNHDKVFTDEQLKPYFDEIIPDGEGIERTFCNIPCYITHYPTEGRVDLFNIVGHIHAAWKYQLNSMNIGVDVNHFYPVDSDTIGFHFKAISEFYDDDVWVGYKDINNFYRYWRGKRGTYFRPT